MRPISNYEHYVISEAGEIINTKSGKAIKPSLNENGYWYVSLWKNNKSKTFSLHRLVAEAYIPNPEEKPFVNHIDANRANPHRNNLEWCDQSHNIKHAYVIGNKTQKKHFSFDELDWLLCEFLKNRTMTDLASSMGVGLSRMTINLRNHAIATKQSAVFESMLKEQKRQRNIKANQDKQLPIHQLNKEGEVIASFPSATAAARALGKNTSGPIHNALTSTNPHATGYGFLWKYA